MQPNAPRHCTRHCTRYGPSIGPGQAKGEFRRARVRLRRHEVRQLVYGPGQIVPRLMSDNRLCLHPGLFPNGSETRCGPKNPRTPPSRRGGADQCQHCPADRFR